MSERDNGGTGRGGVSWPGLNTWRLLLALAALDALAWGLLGAGRPGWLFEYLGVEARNDSWAWQLLVPPDAIPAPRDAGLWHLLAFLALAHAGFLTLAAWRPRSLGGLAVVPLIGHALGAALWLWALGTMYTFPEKRVTFPHRDPLLMLAAHDAVWLPLLLAFLLVWRRHSFSPLPQGARGARGAGWPRKRRPGTVRAASPLPASRSLPCRHGPSSPCSCSP